MIVTTRKGPFIKQFVGPGDNDIVCFKFHQAVIASGCPGECSYCFLQTQRPYRSGMYDLKGTLFSNLRDIDPEAERWLRSHREPAGLILGENQDGLAFEGPYKQLLGVTPLQLLIPLFEMERTNPHGHTLIVLSKFTSTRFAEAFGPQRNVVYSWSLSLPSISRLYEQKVASLRARIAKALDMQSRGYRVRFRLDALAPVEGWKDQLQLMIGTINMVRPEMLTVGALRASSVAALRSAAAANGRDASIFDYIEDVDPSGFKQRTLRAFQEEAFGLIRKGLSSSIPLGLCKEDASMWRAAGYAWRGCHCLHGEEDQVAAPRLHLIRGRKGGSD